MYYNIKIKSKDSQFCLESNDKTVTQREMDIYFAHIFDVSEEFKSKIKKVEITNTNLKSINDIENISIQNQKPQSQTIVIQNSQPIQQSIQQPIQQQASQSILQEKISLEPIIPTPQPTLQMEKEILELAQQMPSIEKIIEEMQMPTNSTPLQANNNQNIQIQDYKINPKKIELTPIDEDGSIETPLEIQDDTSSTSSFQFKDDVAITPIETQEIIPQPEPQIIPSNDGLIFENIQETNFNSTQKPRDIDELIATAQQQINAIDIIQDESDKSLINTASENKNTENNIQTQAQTINEAPTIELQQVPTVTPIEEVQVPVAPQISNDIDAKNQNKINDIFSQTAPCDPVMQNKNETEPIPVTTQNIDQIFSQENQAENVVPIQFEQEMVIQDVTPIQIQQENMAQPIESQQTQQSQEINFGTFLGRLKNINTINDEFLACAFFIKNMLGEESFTMKYINSKLFQTTGKIASTSSADELIANGYLNVINDNESKKYFITQIGEQYFFATYQG